LLERTRSERIRHIPHRCAFVYVFAVICRDAIDTLRQNCTRTVRVRMYLFFNATSLPITCRLWGGRHGRDFPPSGTASLVHYAPPACKAALEAFPRPRRMQIATRITSGPGNGATGQKADIERSVIFIRRRRTCGVPKLMPSEAVGLAVAPFRSGGNHSQ